MALWEEIGSTLAECLEDCTFELAIREIIRERVKSIDQIGQRIMSLLQTGINVKYRINTIHEACIEAEFLFEELRTHYAKLSAMVPVFQYNKYHELWQLTLQRNCLQAALLTYLKTEQIVTMAQVANILGIQTAKDGFHIEDSDFHAAILDIGYELAKLATNHIVAGNYSQPAKISAFLQNIETEYSLKNFKYSLQLQSKLDWFRQCVQIAKTLARDRSATNQQYNTI